MQIKENRTIVQGTALSVTPMSDGWGANVEFRIESAALVKGYEDFLQANPGAVVTVFAAEPGTIKTGKDYTLTVSVLGGPGGERVVVQKAQARK